MKLGGDKKHSDE